MREDLARIARAIGDADPHARALVLTGGFSRGEGTFRRDRPVNDYDLVCVRARAGGAALHARLSDALSHDLGIHVDLRPIWAPRLRVVGKKLFWLDARLGGRVIAGDPRALDALRVFEAADLAPDEGARLLGNRAAGLLLALPGTDEPANEELRDLQATKAILAAMDATLLSRGRYAARLRDRLALVAHHPDHALFAQAVAWKLRGDVDVPDTYWDDAAACLLRAVDATGARDVRDGPAEHAFYLARSRRVAFEPSRRVREAAWDLLARSRWPHAPANAAPVLRRLGIAAPTWSGVRSRFFALRAQTLQ